MELKISHLTTGYNEHIIIDDLSLSIPQEKITALIGANGCGKSTLLKTICRIITPLRGKVLLNGRDVHTADSRELAKIMTILPQNPTAPSGITVQELVTYGRAPYSSALFSHITKEDKKIVDWALMETDMIEFRNHPINYLSGGQRQRAWIAMAIAQNTEILFLDEPTSFLDVAHQMEILRLIKYLNEEYKKTIIMVIHELNQAARFADYIVAMRKGQIRYEGAPHKVFHKKMLRDIFGIDSEIMEDPRTHKPFCIPYSIVDKDLSQKHYIL